MTPKAARVILATQPLPSGNPTPDQAAALETIRRSEELMADFEFQKQADLAGLAALGEMTVPPAIAEKIKELQTTAASSRGKTRFNPLDPATLSVTIGFILLVGLLTWHFLGRSGSFPEEALSVAAEGIRLQTDQFDVVEENAGALADWFLMKGFDRFQIPDEFSNYQAAGARIFKIENQPIAVLAVPENFMFFMVFDPVPFGISVAPEGSWRTIALDQKYAAAIREVDGMCFMVVAPGTRQSIKDLISQKR